MKGTITTVSLLVTLSAGAAVAWGSGSAGAPARTINAIAKGTGITLVDADRNGKPSIGDYEIGMTVYLKAGKQIGSGSVVCTQTNAAGTRYQCQGLQRFPGGDLITAGLFSATSKTYAQAITGGTGVYTGVSGTLNGRWLDPMFARAKVVFTLDG
jgi:hypothetical protein